MFTDFDAKQVLLCCLNLLLPIPASPKRQELNRERYEDRFQLAAGRKKLTADGPMGIEHRAWSWRLEEWPFGSQGGRQEAREGRSQKLKIGGKQM